MADHDLDWFANEVAGLAALIQAPAAYLPTYGRSEDFARPHIEFDGAQFHYVVVERGEELERHSFSDAQEILFCVFESVTFSMACDYEVRHRRAGEDVRRQMFTVQLELMGKLSPAWRQRTKARLDEVLRQHPFDDSTSIASTRCEKLGRFLAAVSLSAPIVAFGILMTITPAAEPSLSRITNFYLSLLVIGAICGVAALSGIYWWGHRNVWMPATLGLAISLFLLGMYYSGHIENKAFQH